MVDVAVPLVDELSALHAAFWGRDLAWLGRHSLSAGGGGGQEGRLAAGAAIVRSTVAQFARAVRRWRPQSRPPVR